MSSGVGKNINQLFVDKFKDFEANLNGQKELPVHQLRKQALDQFMKSGLPDKHEEYKYTNFKRALSKNFDFSQLFNNTSTDASHEDHLIGNLTGNILVFVNGQFSANDSNYNSEEISIATLKEAYKDHSEHIDKHFGNLVAKNNDSFATLNSIFCNDGVYIHIGKNKVVETPTIIYYLSDTTTGEATSFPRNLIVAEENSQSSIIEVFSTIGDGNSFSNSVTEISVAKNAIVDYYKVANDTKNAYHIGLTQVSQERDSTFSAHSFTFGGGIIRNNLHIALEDENCTANMYGIYMLSGESHVDNHTEVDHKKPNSFSNELYKGILDDKSTGVFNGKIFVRQDAQKTNAFQSNKNILLTDDATVNTKPQLEIWADDVKCSHGCTTGQLDNEALFYLRSRGIDEKRAKAMLLYAFATDVIENVKIDSLKEYLDHIIAERFHQEQA